MHVTDLTLGVQYLYHGVCVTVVGTHVLIYPGLDDLAFALIRFADGHYDAIPPHTLQELPYDYHRQV